MSEYRSLIFDTWVADPASFMYAHERNPFDVYRQLSRLANEYAFALGALAHYAAANHGHFLGTNRAVPLVYPELRAKYGDEVTYAEDPSSHLKLEIGYDVLQVARGRYAPPGTDTRPDRRPRSRGSVVPARVRAKRRVHAVARDDDVVERLHKTVRHDWEHSRPLDLTDQGRLADLEDRKEDGGHLLALNGHRDIAD